MVDIVEMEGMGCGGVFWFRSLMSCFMGVFGSIGMADGLRMVEALELKRVSLVKFYRKSSRKQIWTQEQGIY